MYKYSSPGEENNSLINNEHKMKAHVLKWGVVGAGRGGGVVLWARRRGGIVKKDAGLTYADAYSAGHKYTYSKSGSRGNKMST